MQRILSRGVATFILLAVAVTPVGSHSNLGAQAVIRKEKAAPVIRPKVTLPGTSLLKLSPNLRRTVPALVNDSDSAGLTIVTFNTALGLSSVNDLFTPVTGVLARNGVALTAPARLESLGMIAVVLTKAQLAGLAAEPSVLSIWDNYPLHYDLHQARVLCGVDKLRADATLTARNNGKVVDGAGDGAPVTGQPNRPQFSVVVIDSGISTSGGGATTGTPDLYYDNSSVGVIDPTTQDHYTVAPTIPNSKVIQNVQVTVNAAASTTLTYTENQLENDSVGHGSHCAGIVGGTGAFSKANGEDFSGVAPGVKIIGCGSGAGLFVLDALGGMNYSLNFQQFYNVRITSNSYGSDGPYDANDPLNVAIKAAYDHNITTVFAAGNSGPGVDTIGIQAKSPYVICVAAGTKEGGLASFSSRGKAAGERVAGSIDEFNLPAITAPGTGREFVFDSPYDPAASTPYVNGVTAANPDTVGKKFYSDIISTRSKLPGAAAGLNDQEFPAQYAPVYTMISGTSMACPFVAGTCALLLDADPTLTPAAIKNIIQATATHMPDYRDFEVGAGYLNAYAAVDMAFNPGKPYKPFNRVDQPYAASYPAFVTNINTAPVAAPGRPTGYPPTTVKEGSATLHDEDYTLPYSTNSASAADYTAAKTKAQTNDNAYAFLVDANADGTPNLNLTPSQKTTTLDARIQFGNDPVGLGVGNTIGLLLWAPDGTFYSSGIALPVEDAANRQVVVKNPKPGLWVAEFRGIRGLAAIPITPPTGVGLPDTVNGQIYRTNNVVTNPPTDTNGLPQQANINFALLNRYLDQPSSGLFQPSATVNRAAFAQILADNVPLRQSLSTASTPYNDATGATARFAEAAAQSGSTLRDWDFSPGATLPTTSATFAPNLNVSRMQVATALVKAVGLDAEAAHLAGTVVKVPYNNALVPVNDAYVLLPAQRGYLQLALNRGLISYLVQYDSNTGAYSATATPNKNITRADLATAIVNFRALFPVGNSLSATEYAPQTN